MVSPTSASSKDSVQEAEGSVVSNGCKEHVGDCDLDQSKSETTKVSTTTASMTDETAEQNGKNGCSVVTVPKSATSLDNGAEPEFNDNLTEEFEKNGLKAELASEYKPKPPDGGYGWFIVLASFLVHVLTSGIGRSDGLFFLLFEDRFNESATLIAALLSVSGILRLALGPIASAISQRWSVRACVLMGGLGLGLVQLLSAFSSSFSVLFLSHGFLQGIFRGLVYGPSLILVNMYFEVRRSFATGLSTSGDGIGTLLMVPLIQVLFDTYGFTGGFLVLSAVCFNGVFMAMLFRPLSMHYRFVGKKGVSVENPSPSETVMLSDLAGVEDTASLRSLRLRSTVSINDEAEREEEGLIDHQIHEKSPSNGTCSDTLVLNGHSPHLRPRPHRNHCWKSTFDIIFPRENHNIHHQRKTADGKTRRAKLFHFGLLREPAFLGFCLSLGLFTATFKSTFTFMPALAKASGLTKSEAVFILSISGAVDTAGRIVAGFLLDKPFLSEHRLVIYICVEFFLAGVCALMPLLGKSFLWLCAASCVFGVMTGFLSSQKSVVCVDILDAERMPSAFGILLLFQGVGIGIGPLLSGVCRDVFGRFHEAFYLGAALMAFSACLMIYSTVLHRLSKRRQR